MYALTVHTISRFESIRKQRHTVTLCDIFRKKEWKWLYIFYLYKITFHRTLYLFNFLSLWTNFVKFGAKVTDFVILKPGLHVSRFLKSFSSLSILRGVLYNKHIELHELSWMLSDLSLVHILWSVLSCVLNGMRTLRAWLDSVRPGVSTGICHYFRH